MRKTALVIVAILALAFSQIEGGAKCYRMLDLNLSSASSDTVEVTSWNGSGEIAFFLNITGYTKKASGSAGTIIFYVEIQDSLWALRLTTESITSNSYTVASGYKRGTVALYSGLTNVITGNKVYGEKFWIAYVANADSLGHITMDVCIKKDR